MQDKLGKPHSALAEARLKTTTRVPRHKLDSTLSAFLVLLRQYKQGHLYIKLHPLLKFTGNDYFYRPRSEGYIFTGVCHFNSGGGGGGGGRGGQGGVDHGPGHNTPSPRTWTWDLVTTPPSLPGHGHGTWSQHPPTPGHGHGTWSQHPLPPPPRTWTWDLVTTPPPFPPPPPDMDMGPGHNTPLPPPPIHGHGTWSQHLPPPGQCAGGRYASYWNAFLFL